MVKKGNEYGFRLDGWYFPSVAYADDTCGDGNIMKNIGTNAFGPHRRFRETERGHAETNWS